ncbi:unnamed protein product [Periconia digitata]|uniref:Ankyrin repeat protein n=1 Tax=Periconia digitata TaxID=1303443 RepID=A0A9W4U580_9PLEO|nr:unnamed protein product [Periconia digitata]
MPRLPTAKELNLFDEEVPEGMALSCMPPAQEHYEDPFWYDSGGRNPFHRKRVHRMIAGEERKTKIREIIEEFPRYGPAMYEWAVDENDPTLVAELFELGVSTDIKEAKKKDESKGGEDDLDVDEDQSYPQLEMMSAFHNAAFDGKMECVKIFVEVGHIDINEKDDRDTTPLTNALLGGHEEIVDWLFDHGANITFEAEVIDDMQAAVRSCKVAIVKKLLEHPQSVKAKLQIETSHLLYAAASNNDPLDMVRFVLESSCFGSPVTRSQTDAIMESLYAAVAHGSIETLRLMLPFVTKQKEDGSFEYVELSDSHLSEVFNATEDAMKEQDIPELFKLVWETLLCGPNTITNIHNETVVTTEDRLNRRLISACAEGCPETCRLLVDQYGADIHHISHKYSTTPLSRATGSSANPLERRLPVARYLLEEKHANIHLADGEYANSATPLAVFLKSGARGQHEMVKLVLKNGGPLEEIGGDVSKVLEDAEAGATVKLHLVLYKGPREPVKLMTEAQPDGENQTEIEASKEYWQTWLGSIQIRKPDEVLAREDPKSRPLE